MSDTVHIEGRAYQTNSREMWDARGRENFAKKNWRVRPEECKAIAALMRGSVIEIGCAFGALAAYVPADLSYLGVDWSLFMIEEARKFHPRHAFIVADAFTLPTYVQRFDTAVALQWIEHYTEPQQCIELLSGLASRLILGVPRGHGKNRCHIRAWANEDAVRADFGDVQFFEGASEHICWYQDIERRE